MEEINLSARQDRATFSTVLAASDSTAAETRSVRWRHLGLLNREFPTCLACRAALRS